MRHKESKWIEDLGKKLVFMLSSNGETYKICWNKRCFKPKQHLMTQTNKHSYT